MYLNSIIQNLKNTLQIEFEHK